MIKFLSSLQNLTYRDGFWLLFGAMMGSRIVDLAVLWFMKLKPSEVPLTPIL